VVHFIYKSKFVTVFSSHIAELLLLLVLTSTPTSGKVLL